MQPGELGLMLQREQDAIKKNFAEHAEALTNKHHHHHHHPPQAGTSVVVTSSSSTGEQQSQTTVDTRNLVSIINMYKELRAVAFENTDFAVAA
eukprot:10528457-Lingulodinium_polyedra.AAC.1